MIQKNYDIRMWILLTKNKTINFLDFSNDSKEAVWIEMPTQGWGIRRPPGAHSVMGDGAGNRTFKPMGQGQFSTKHGPFFLILWATDHVWKILLNCVCPAPRTTIQVFSLVGWIWPMFGGRFFKNTPGNPGAGDFKIRMSRSPHGGIF